MLKSHPVTFKGTLKQTAMLTAYRTLGCILLPVLPIALLLRARKQPDYKKRMRERFGILKIEQGRKTIVIHGSSLGEISALKPVIERCIEQYPDHLILVTSFTPAGSTRIQQLFQDRVAHSYLPFDIWPCSALFLHQVRPELIIFMETEIWPNLIHQAKARNIPLLLINARISDKSLPVYRKYQSLFTPCLQIFSAILCQSPTNAQRFKELGATPEQVSISGNLKFDVEPLNKTDEINSIQHDLGNRPVWLIASSHEDEEGFLLSTLINLKAQQTNLLCIWAPRHVERFIPLYELIKTRNLKVEKRSTRSRIEPETDILLLDTHGELVKFYSLATVSTVCGSFNQTGGHNPLEPIQQNSMTSFGPNMANSNEIVELLLDSKAAYQHQESEAEKVSLEINQLLEDSERRNHYLVASKKFLVEHKGSIEKTMSAISKILN